MTVVVREVLVKADKPKNGGKRKAKAGISEPAPTLKKKKRATRRQRTPTPSVEDDSESNTISNVRSPERVQHKHDNTAATSHPMV